jgi:hypothetical protein
MPRIAVTGHMNLASGTIALVRTAIDTELNQFTDDEELIGISCLARGADSIFAAVILERGGTLEVVLPSANYRETKVKADHRQQFDYLLERAHHVHVMEFEDANRIAYEAANEELVGRCDRLFAVWDGESAQKGGTGTVVELARTRRVPVNVIWPAGAARE